MSSVIRHDLMCSDLEVAYRFYAELFGWVGLDVKIKGFEMKRLTMGERVIGALVPSRDEPAWIPYVQVADVDACCHRINGLGGDIWVSAVSGPPGRYAAVADPTGAVFSPFEPRTVPAWAADAPPDNAFAWDQLMTSDPDAARAFYVDLLGWSSHVIDGRIVLASDELPVASIVADREVSAWLPFIKVDDVDRTVRVATELGASVDRHDHDATLGPIAVLRDPSGATIGVGDSLAVRLPALPPKNKPPHPTKQRPRTITPIPLPTDARLASIRAVANRRR